MGDRVQLRQVILNLLLNAGEAMEEHRRPYLRQALIKTEARERRDYVGLSVQDAGVGFDPGTAERTSSSHSTRARKTGWGWGSR